MTAKVRCCDVDRYNVGEPENSPAQMFRIPNMFEDDAFENVCKVDMYFDPELTLMLTVTEVKVKCQHQILCTWYSQHVNKDMEPNVG